MGFKVIRTTGLFFLVIGAIFWLQQPNLNSTGKNHKNYSSLLAFADENVEVTIAEMTLGSEEAEVHIVEYALSLQSLVCLVRDRIGIQIRQLFVRR